MMFAELAGTLTEKEADEILRNIEELREATSGDSGQKQTKRSSYAG